MRLSRIVDLRVGHLHSLLRGSQVLCGTSTIAIPRLTLELDLRILPAAHVLDAPEELQKDSPPKASASPI